jgi:hypothetical protein
MNPRIQELYIKTLSEECSNPALVDIEKFAELIVRECARVASDRVMDVEGNDWGVRWAIKNHFGVEL